MSEKTINKIPNVPNLRFSKYSEIIKLWRCSDFLKTFSTNSLSWDQLSYIDESEFKNLHYGLIHNGAPTLINCEEYQLPFMQSKIKNYTLCKNGDIIFADASEDTKDICKPVEFINIANNKVVSGLHTIHARDIKELTVIGFKGYLFSSYNFHKQVHRLTQGTKIFSINPGNFKEMYVGIPDVNEQKDIVYLFSKIDKRIESQNKIIEEIKSQIFSISYIMVKSISKTIPVKEICIFERKTKHQSGDGLLGGNYPFFTNEEETVKYFNTYDFDGEYIIANTGGKANFKYHNGKFTTMSDCLVIRFRNSLLTKFYSIVFSVLQKYIDYIGFEGSGLKHLNKDWFLKLQVPQCDENAEKFICIINDLKEKLQIEKDILSLYKKQKAYLLQNMFI